MPLDYDFTPYCDLGVRRLVDFEERDQLAELILAAEAMLAQFDAAAPSRFDRGLASKEDIAAERHVLNSIVGDLRVDAERREQLRAWLAGRNAVEPEPVNVLIASAGLAPWEAKVAALRRQISDRRQRYDTDCDKGLTSPTEAVKAIERLEAIHAKYWLDGFAFDGGQHELAGHMNGLYAAGQRFAQKDQAA